MESLSPFQQVYSSFHEKGPICLKLPISQPPIIAQQTSFSRSNEKNILSSL